MKQALEDERTAKAMQQKEAQSVQEKKEAKRISEKKRKEEEKKRKEEDKKRKEETETRNTAEQLVYSTDKFLADNGDKIPAETKTEVEGALGELKEALADATTSAEDLTAKTSKGNEVSQKMGAAMYAQEQAAGAESGAGEAGAQDASATGGSDDVVDAEVVDDEDTK